MWLKLLDSSLVFSLIFEALADSASAATTYVKLVPCFHGNICKRIIFHRLGFLLFFVLVAQLFLGLPVAAHAAITATGDVSPDNPGNWTSNTYGYIGKLSSGTLLVDDGSGLMSGNVYLSAGGIATVTDSGSIWTNSGGITVGSVGNGTLNIEASGQVVNYQGYLGYNIGSLGTVRVTGSGSKWTNSANLYIGNYGSGTLTVEDGGTVTAKTLYASLHDLLGNGIVTIKGAVLDNDLLFDSIHGVKQTISFGTGGTLNLNLDGTADLGAGYRGNGTLAIADGITATSPMGYLGYLDGSTGKATVTGAASKWTCNGLYVGYHGSGALNVTDGGTVSAGYLFIGYYGSGTLTVANGGVVTSTSLYGSLNDLQGDGTITTNGAVLDSDIVFDSTHGSTIDFGAGGKLNFNLTGSGELGAGFKHAGSLRIADGVAIASSSGYLGYLPGSSGTATITGANSKWTLSGSLSVGSGGNGSLIVEAGGQVKDSKGYLGLSTASGTALITGIGSTWTNTSDLQVSNGNLNVEAGGQVSNGTGYLGYSKNSSSIATITGVGSKWTNSGSLTVGYSGNGNLIVTDGGTVSITNSLYLGQAGSGTLTVNNGGSVTTGHFFGSLNDLSGNGVITTNGAVLDADLVFDGAHGAQQSMAFGAGGKLMINTNGNGVLGAGYKGTGSLKIADGLKITSSSGYLGYRTGSIGSATVTDNGSQWSTNSLYVGKSGTGALSVTNGGKVSITNTLYVGNNAIQGTLNVDNGGSVITGELFASLNDLAGNGLITTGGAVLDADLVFDRTHGTTQTIPFGTGGALKLQLSTSWDFGAGYKGIGSINIVDGVTINSSSGFLGYGLGSLGTATISGTGSKWNNSGALNVGMDGNGILDIEMGGEVSDSYGYLGYALGSNSLAKIVGSGSKWINSGELRVGGSGSGSGILDIEAGGQVSNTNGYLSSSSSSNSSAKIVGSGSKWTNSGELNIGTNSILVIEAGGEVSNTNGYLGSFSSSLNSSAKIVGSGSKWTNSGNLYFSNGNLTIESGGQVSSAISNLGYSTNSTGKVIVSGKGSIWNNSRLSIGYSNAGNGTVYVLDGGVINAGNTGIFNQSMLEIDVGSGSTLNVGNGSGTFTNSSKVRVVAGASSATNSSFVPIAASRWQGTGIVEAVGGTWDATSHVFTVSQALNGVSGTPVAVDLALQQRVLIGESSLNRTVGASFLAKTGTGKTFNLTAIALADVPALGGLLQPWESVWNAWTFTAEGAGYVATDPVYLSFSVPSNFSRDDVKLWKLTGSTWSAFNADDLTVTGGYASFTSTGLSGYAVTVPEPAVMVLLFTAFMGGLIVWRRRR